MLHKYRNPIEAYTEAACLIARSKLYARIGGLPLDACRVSNDTLRAIERLAEAFPDRDMAKDLDMPAMHRIKFDHARSRVLENREQLRHMACDSERIWEKLAREVGGCGQYYELWLPRMMRAISSHISRYHVNDAVAAVLWAKVDCGPEGPTDKDWEEAAGMEREVWAEIREATE